MSPSRSSSQRPLHLAMLATLLLAVLFLLASDDPAAAQGFTPRFPGDVPLDVQRPDAPLVSGDALDKVDDAFQDMALEVGGRLAEIARNLLLSLLLIEMVWSLGQIVMTRGDFGRLMSTFFRRIIIAGFFLFLMEGIPTPNGNVGIATFVLMSAEALAGVTIDASLKPGEVWNDMHRAGWNIYDNTSGIGRSMIAALVWVITSFLGAIIAGLMMLAYIEIYVVFTVGVLTLGFGVWKQTEAWARNFLFGAVGKIFKVFTLLLIVSVVRLQQENMGQITEIEDGLLLIGMTLIFIMIVARVPGTVEAMISGTPGGSADQQLVETATMLPGKGIRSAGGAAVGGTGKAVRAGGKVAWNAGVKPAAGQLAAGLRTIRKRMGGI